MIRFTVIKIHKHGNRELLLFFCVDFVLASDFHRWYYRFHQTLLKLNSPPLEHI